MHIASLHSHNNPVRYHYDSHFTGINVTLRKQNLGEISITKFCFCPSHLLTCMPWSLFFLLSCGCGNQRAVCSPLAPVFYFSFCSPFLLSPVSDSPEQMNAVNRGMLDNGGKAERCHLVNIVWEILLVLTELRANIRWDFCGTFRVLSATLLAVSPWQFPWFR